MTPEQEKTLIEAVRYLLLDKHQVSRIEARKIAREHGYSDTGTRERIRELDGDADYCQELINRL